MLTHFLFAITITLLFYNVIIDTLSYITHTQTNKQIIVKAIVSSIFEFINYFFALCLECSTGFVRTVGVNFSSIFLFPMTSRRKRCLKRRESVWERGVNGSSCIQALNNVQYLVPRVLTTRVYSRCNRMISQGLSQSLGLKVILPLLHSPLTLTPFSSCVKKHGTLAMKS